MFIKKLTTLSVATILGVSLILSPIQTFAAQGGGAEGSDTQSGETSGGSSVSSIQEKSIPVAVSKSNKTAVSIGDENGGTAQDDSSIPNITKVVTYSDNKEYEFEIKLSKVCRYLNSSSPETADALYRVEYTTESEEGNVQTRVVKFFYELAENLPDIQNVDAFKEWVINAGYEVDDDNNVTTAEIYSDTSGDYTYVELLYSTRLEDILTYYKEFLNKLSEPVVRIEMSSDMVGFIPDPISYYYYGIADSNHNVIVKSNASTGNIYLPLDIAKENENTGDNYISYVSRYSGSMSGFKEGYIYTIKESSKDNQMINYSSAVKTFEILLDFNVQATGGNSGELNITSASASINYSSTSDDGNIYFLNANLDIADADVEKTVFFEVGSDGSTNTRTCQLVPNSETGVPELVIEDASSNLSYNEKQGFKGSVLAPNSNNDLNKVLLNNNISSDEYKNAFNFDVYWIENPNTTNFDNLKASDFTLKDTNPIYIVQNNNGNIYGVVPLTTAMYNEFKNNISTNGLDSNLSSDFYLLIKERADTNNEKIKYDTNTYALGKLTLSYQPVDTTGYNGLLTTSFDILNADTVTFTNIYRRTFDANKTVVEIGSDPTNPNEKTVTIDSDDNVTVGTPDATDGHNNPTVSNPSNFDGVITGKTNGETITKTLQNGNIADLASPFEFDVAWVDNNYNIKKVLGQVQNTNGTINKFVRIDQDMLDAFSRYLVDNSTGQDRFNILITERNSGSTINGIDYNVGNKSIGCTLVLSMDDNYILHTDMKDYFIHDMSKTGVTFGSERTETSSYYSSIGFVNKQKVTPDDIVIEIGSDPTDDDDDRVVKKDDGTNGFDVTKTTEKDSDNKPTVPTGGDKKKSTVVGSTDGEIITKELLSADISKDKFNNAFEFKVEWIEDDSLVSKGIIGTASNINSNVHSYMTLPEAMKDLVTKYLKNASGGKNEFRILITEVDKGLSSYNYNVDDTALIATLTITQDKNEAIHSDVHDYKTISGYSTIDKNNPDITKISNGITPFKNKYIKTFDAKNIVIEIGSDPTKTGDKKITVAGDGTITDVSNTDATDTDGKPTVSNPSTFNGSVAGKTVGESLTKTLLRDNINNYSFDFDVNLVDNNFVKTTNSYLGSFSNTASNLHSYIKATSEIASEFTKYVNTNGAEGKNTFNILITEREPESSNGIEYNIGNKSIGCTLELTLDSNDIVHTDVKDYFIHDNTKNVQFGAEKSETSSYYRPTSGIGFINIAYGDIRSSSGTLIAELGYDPSNTGYRVVVPNKDNPNSSTISNTTTTDSNNIPSVPSSNAYRKVILDSTGSNENVTKTFINGKINQATFKFNISSVRDDYTKVVDMSTVTNNAGSLHNLFTVPNSILHDFAQSVHYDINTSSFIGSKTFNLNVQEVIPQSSAGVKYNIGNKNVSFKLKLYMDNNGVVHADTYDYYIHNANGHNNFGEELNIAFNNEGDFGFTTADKFNEYYYPSTGLGFINSKNKYTVGNFSGISLNSANLKSSKVGSKANTTDASKVKEITLNLSKLNAFVAETLDFSRLELTTDSEGNDYVLEYGVDGVVLGLRRLLTTYKGGARRYGTGDFSNVGLLIGVLGTVITLLLVTIMAIVYVKKSTKKEIK